MNIEPGFIAAEEAGRLHECSKAHILYLAKNKRIESIRIEGRIYVRIGAYEFKKKK